MGGQKVRKNCLHCGKGFTPRQRKNAPVTFGLYCSRKCHYSYKRSLPPGDFRPRFWAKVNKNGPLWNGTPCWIWTASRDSTGYGRFGLPRIGTTPAYWTAWILLRGDIDKSLQFDHLCRNRICVNPDHLEPVPQAVNLLRGISPPAQNARKTHCKRGHELTPENTYKAHGWRVCLECKRMKVREWFAAHPGYHKDWKQKRKDKIA